MLKRSLLVALLFMINACTQSEPEFEALGVYVSTDDGYQVVEPLSRSRMDYSEVVTPSETDDNNITFYVYDTKLEVDKLVVAQTGLINIKPQKLKHQIKPLKKEGTYAITAQMLDPDLPIILLSMGGLFSAKSYMVSIKDIETQLVQELKSQQDLSTRTKYQHVASVLKSFPENAELLAMKSALEKQRAKENEEARRRNQQRNDDHVYMQALHSEKAYQSREKWIQKYQEYLAKYPKGTHVKEAQARIKAIQADIDEEQQIYAKQLQHFGDLASEFVQAIQTQDKERLAKIAYNPQSAERWLKARRLMEADLTSTKAYKFHYSNPKSRNHAYVQVSGSPLKRFDMKLRDNQWYVASYRI
jgi:hypothetical protein